MGLSKHILFILLSLLLCTTNISYAQANKDRRAILKLIKTQNKAYKQGDAEQVVACYHSNTIDYWTELLRLARFADSTELMTVTFNQIDWVFDIRYHVPSTQLDTMDGASLLAFFSTPNGKPQKPIFSFGSITVSADSAYARVIHNRYPTPYFFKFYKEDGKWLIDKNGVYDQINAVSGRYLTKQNCAPIIVFYAELAEEWKYKCPGFDPWKPKG